MILNDTTGASRVTSHQPALQNDQHWFCLEQDRIIIPAAGQLATVQNMTSYNVAFLSPEPVMMYLSSFEMSLHSTDDDSFDCNKCTHRY